MPLIRDCDILIKGGSVIDGTGSPPYQADIAIKGERIAYIGQYSGTSGDVIDATGLIVSPGFIDVHAHSEFNLLIDERAEGKLSQGVTTEINGNCGLSGGPLLGEAKKQREREIKDIRWTTLGEYLRVLEDRGLVINFATLSGHGNIRASVVGYSDRRATQKEMACMEGLLEESLRDGALGLSTGLIYPPGMWSDSEEIKRLCKAGLSTGLPFIYTTHMRSEGDSLLEAIDEVVEIGEGSGSPVHISHLKTSGRRNWHKAPLVVERLNSLRERGFPITCDRYPYIAAQTDLDSVLPRWALEGGNQAVLDRLRAEDIRNKIKEELKKERRSWHEVVVSDVLSLSNKWIEGLSIEEIAKRTKKDPIDTLIDILIDEGLIVGGIFFSMSEENLRGFLRLPYLMIGSDSAGRSKDGPTAKGKPHPRGFGSFTRFLGRYVRELRLLELPDAIRRITSLPAEIFKIKGRGLIKEGYYADIVVFEEEGIIDRATFKEPFLLSDGIRYVIINGSVAFKDKALTGRQTGRVLRNGS